jgi:tRNA(fMet)-specific endonuclease VapC
VIASAVVDTDVVSFLLRRDTRAELYRPHLTDRLLVISFMTLAELRRWALKYQWGQRRRAAFAAYLEQFTVDWPDEALSEQWAQVMAQAERAGRPISGADAWQAATALLSGVPLISHNRRDYAGVGGLTLISEAPR